MDWDIIRSFAQAYKIVFFSLAGRIMRFIRVFLSTSLVLWYFILMNAAKALVIIIFLIQNHLSNQDGGDRGRHISYNHYQSLR